MTHEQNAELVQRRDACKRLAANADYRAILAPLFAEKFKEHVTACRNRDLTPEKRAEHIEAANLSEILTGYLENQQKSAQDKLDRGRK